MPGGEAELSRARAGCAAAGLVLWRSRMSGSERQAGGGPGGASSDLSDSDKSNNPNNAAATSRKRFGLTRVMPKEGKKRVNYSKGDARRIMEEAVSLCEVMSLGYEVVFHGRRRSCAGHRSGIMSDGTR